MRRDPNEQQAPEPWTGTVSALLKLDGARNVLGPHRLMLGAQHHAIGKRIADSGLPKSHLAADQIASVRSHKTSSFFNASSRSASVGLRTTSRSAFVTYTCAIDVEHPISTAICAYDSPAERNAIARA
jgi:hypothetical protein